MTYGRKTMQSPQKWGGRIDFAHSTSMWTQGTSIPADDTMTYSAPSDGIIAIFVRVGTYSTPALYINDTLVTQCYLDNLTGATTIGGAPILPYVAGLEVKKGDIVKMKRTFGSYAWIQQANFMPKI